MNYFVLFSVILIAASVIVLLIPPTTEGFTSATKANANMKPNANANAKPKPSASRPAAAGQHNLSSNAGTADGGSNNQHLIDDLLAQQDRFVEAFENRTKPNKANAVLSTTTKKKGIASTGASTNDANDEEGGNVNPPVAGCNKKCVKISDPMMALGGNCINPPRADGAPNELDYSIKYCPAFQPPNDLREQDCMTCGYYKFTSKCKSDPNDPKKPCDYEDYKYAEYQSGPMPGTNGGDDGGDGGDGGDGEPICSATTCGPKTVTVDGTQCIIPGCVSNDGGMMPYPDNFYGNRTTNPCYPIKDDKGGTNGFMCPAITSGEVYDMGGGSSDLCYTTNGVVDPTKFFKMDKICSNDKQKSKQKFVPGKDAPIDGNDMPPPINTKHRSMNSTMNHQHGGAINVYHHSSKQNQGQCSKGQGKGGKQGQYGNSSNSNTYIDPVGDTTVLGYL